MSLRPSPIVTSDLPRLDSSIGSSPRSALQEERREQLAKEFAQIDANKDNFLSYEEIYNFLTERQREPFDEALCRDLFSKMDKDNDNQISLDEFVDSYTDTEEKLIKRIKQLKNEIQKHKESLTSNQEKIPRAQKQEVFNSSGIMIGSELRICVISAKELTPANTKGTANPFIVLQFENLKFATQVKSDNLNPVWNESFNFKIEKRGGELEATVKNKSTFGEAIIGKVLIPLNTLSGQMKNQQYYILTDESGRTCGKLLLELQWIWSNTKYLTDICGQISKIITERENRLEQLREKLDNLRRPFGNLMSLGTHTDMIGTPVSGTNSVGEILPNKFSVTSMRFSIIVENEDYLYYSIILYMLLSVIINFSRPDFFNVAGI